jgi:hypothetical protein
MGIHMCTDDPFNPVINATQFTFYSNPFKCRFNLNQLINSNLNEVVWFE